jgi:Spy/CpxP family protein refolding chaperone
VRVLIGIVVAAFVLGAGVAKGGDACCASGKDDAKACSAAAVSNLVAKLSLTDDQTAKVKDICAKYAQAERTAATASNCMAEVVQLLTPEQAAKFKEMSQGKVCPVQGTDSPVKKAE